MTINRADNRRRIRRNLIFAIALICALFGVTAAGAVDPPHNPASGYKCASCHATHLNLGNTGFTNACLTCHHPGDSRAGTKPFMRSDAADPFATYTTNRHRTLFQTSHRWEGPDLVLSAGALPPLDERLNKPRMLGEISCMRCHDQHLNTYRPFLRMANDNDELCLDCHRSRNATSHVTGTHPVNVNYSGSKPMHRPPVNANPANPTAAMQLKNGKVFCTTCHGVHYSDSDSSTFDNHSGYRLLKPSQGFLLRTDLRGAMATAVNICTNCHADKKNHNYKNQNVQCADCHAAHVDYDPQDPAATLGKNSYLIRRYMNISTATTMVRQQRVFHLTTSAYTRIYKDSGGTGVCQACHVVPTGGKFPLAHNLVTATARDCSLCHNHNSSYGAFSAAGSCTACHGYPPLSSTMGGPDGLAIPPTIATSPPSPGAHETHVVKAVMGCETCHNGYAAKPMPSYTIDIGFSVNGSTYRGFAGSATTGSFTGTNSLDAAYSWNSVNSPGTTIITAAGASPTCSNLYCHGATLTGGSITAPVWTATNQAACGTCHGATPTAPPTTGNHLRHAGNNPGGLAISCDRCHGSFTGTSHINGTVRWDLTGIDSLARYQPAGGTPAQSGDTAVLAPSPAYGGCFTLYCHSNVQGPGGAGFPSAFASPTWGGAPLSCSSCHPDMTIGPAATGSHLRHTQAFGYSCTTCHYGAGSNTTRHGDSLIQVSFNPTYGGSYSQSPNIPGNGYGSCTNVYCHGSTAPTWGSGSLPADCSGCHSGGITTGPNYPNGSPKANSHLRHTATYSCNFCHYNVTTNGTSITNAANHINKIYDITPSPGVTFSVTAGTGTPTSPALCTNISCHGNNSATWGTSIYCQNCHGATTDTDDFSGSFWNNGTMGKIAITGQWDLTGHGRPAGSGHYDSDNPAADFAGIPNPCEFCHDPGVGHKTSANLFRLKNYSSAQWGRNAVCQVCHGTGSPGMTVSGLLRNGTKKVGSRHLGAKHVANSTTGGQFCWDCHDPHGDNNIFMVHDWVARGSDPVSGAPTTTARTLFAMSVSPTTVWGDYVKPAYDGICQVCHTPGSTQHFNSATYDAGHNSGGVCTACHPHTGNDKASALAPIGECNACHGYPPVRRGLAAGSVFRYNNYSFARFQDYSGGGGAHSIEAHVKSTARASESWSNCAICHSNGSMNPTTHQMTMPLKPSTVTIDIGERSKYDYQRPAGPERYSGKLSDNHDNQTGSCSNVKCHFKTSKKWSTEK